MSIIESVKTFIEAFPELEQLAPIHVDEIEPKAVNYSIDPVPGTRVLETDVLGNRTREYPFTLSSRKITADDITRITNNGFFEMFADWLDEQTDAESLPDLGAGKAAEKIEATSWGYLYQRDENDQTGIYQIICKLTYSEQKG